MNRNIEDIRKELALIREQRRAQHESHKNAMFGGRKEVAQLQFKIQKIIKHGNDTAHYKHFLYGCSKDAPPQPIVMREATLLRQQHQSQILEHHLELMRRQMNSINLYMMNERLVLGEEKKAIESKFHEKQQEFIERQNQLMENHTLFVHSRATLRRSLEKKNQPPPPTDTANTQQNARLSPMRPRQFISAGVNRLKEANARMKESEPMRRVKKVEPMKRIKKLSPMRRRQPKAA